MPPDSDLCIRHMDSATVDELTQVLNSPEILTRGFCELDIDSVGGDVKNGLKMIELIKGSRAPVNATVSGRAASMAAVILQCCAVRRMRSTATLHYHYGSWRISFLVYFDAEMAALNRTNAVKYQQSLIEPITARTGMSEDSVHSLLREDRKLSATECFERGLIDELI